MWILYLPKARLQLLRQRVVFKSRRAAEKHVSTAHFSVCCGDEYLEVFFNLFLPYKITEGLGLRLSSKRSSSRYGRVRGPFRSLRLVLDSSSLRVISSLQFFSFQLSALSSLRSVALPVRCFRIPEEGLLFL